MSFFEETTLRDGAGNLIASFVNPDSTHALVVSATQYSIADANNTSTTNLAAGATFTGTKTNTLGSQSIQVILLADQACTVNIDQSGDGTNYDITDTYYYNTQRSFSITCQAAGKAYRIRVTNTGLSTTTTFRLEAFIAPISNTLPRSLDALGNLRVGVNALADQYGFTGSFDPSHQLAIAEPFHLVGPVFVGTVTDTNFWTVGNSGAGSGADIGSTTTSVATLTSGTANSGYGKLASVCLGRFIPGSPGRFKGYLRLTALSVANTIRAWGAVTLSTVAPQDGFFFSVNGSGILSVNSASGGAVMSVASGSFNGTVETVTLDTNLHTYEIVYTSSGAWFLVDGVLIHTMLATTAPLVTIMTLPIGAWSANSASGTASAVLQCFNVSIYRLGRGEATNTSHYFSAATTGTVLKYGAGEVHRLLISAPAANNVITLYDNTAASGTVLWGSGTINNAGNPLPFFMDLSDLPFFNGLTYVQTGNTGVTIIYE